jgi:hypothetical protein
MKTSRGRQQAMVLIVSLVITSAVSSNAVFSQGTHPVNRGKPTKPALYTTDSYKRFDQPPSNFPVPIYTSNVKSAVYGEATAKDGRHSITATIKTTDQPAIAFQWYQQAVQTSGFEMYKTDPSKMRLPANIQMFNIVADKGDQRLFLSCSHFPQLPETVISITITSTR